VKLTIITATLNAEQHILEALESSDGTHEHLVVDGGSQDATQALLSGKRRVRWIAAPGAGIYEAWNIGIRKAAGDVVLFLNADDRLECRDLTPAIDCFARDERLRILGGGVRYFSHAAMAGPSSRTVSEESASVLALDDVLFGVPAINAHLFRRCLFEEIGLFDTRFALAADREWLLRCVLAGVPQAAVDGPLYGYRVHEGSRTLSPAKPNALAIGREHMAIATEHLRRAPPEHSVPLRRFFRHAGVTAAAAAARSGDVFALLGVCASQVRHDPLWPARVPLIVGEKLRRRRRDRRRRVSTGACT